MNTLKLVFDTYNNNVRTFAKPRDLFLQLSFEFLSPSFSGFRNFWDTEK